MRQNRVPVKPERKREEVEQERTTLKEMQEQYGGAGVFNFPMQEHFLLDNPDWKYDQVPEIMDGKNIMDFVDEDILEKLEKLELEEQMVPEEMEEEQMDDEEKKLWKARKEITSKRKLLKEEHKLRVNNAVHLHRPTVTDMKEDLGEKKGIDTTFLEERMKKRDAQLQKRKVSRHKSLTRVAQDLHDESNDMEDEQGRPICSYPLEQQTRRAAVKATNKTRSLSRTRVKGTQIQKTAQEEAMDRVKRKLQRYDKNEAKAGEGDRKIYNHMPKHLFSGKRKQGKHDYR